MTHAVRCTRLARWAPLALALFNLISPNAHATEGFQLIGVGPVQRGTGGAGVAGSGDATWMMLNPAAIADLDRQFDFYFEHVGVRRTIEPRGLVLIVNPLAGKMADASPANYPSFASTWKWGKWTLGAGMLGLGGTEVDFPRPRTTLALRRNSDRRSSLEIAHLPFTAARRFDNGWAVGFTLHGALERLRTDTLTLRLRPAEADNKWDYAFGIGVGMGAQKRWDKWAIGASYISRIAMQDLDEYQDHIIRHNLDMPQKFQAGLAYYPNPKWEVFADYKVIDYSSVKQLGGGTFESALGWNDVEAVKFGMRYHPTERWTLRAGYSRNNSPVGDDNIFVNAHFPALAEDHFSVGFSYDVNENYTVHAGYTHAIREKRKDNGQGDLFSILGRGTEMSLELHMVNAGITWRF